MILSLRSGLDGCRHSAASSRYWYGAIDKAQHPAQVRGSRAPLRQIMSDVNDLKVFSRAKQFRWREYASTERLGLQLEAFSMMANWLFKDSASGTHPSRTLYFKIKQIFDAPQRFVLLDMSRWLNQSVKRTWTLTELSVGKYVESVSKVHAYQCEWIVCRA